MEFCCLPLLAYTTGWWVCGVVQCRHRAACRLPLQKLFSRTTELKLLSRSSEVEFHSSADRISVLASQHLDGDNQLMVAEIRSAEEWNSTLPMAHSQHRLMLHDGNDLQRQTACLESLPLQITTPTHFGAYRFALALLLTSKALWRHYLLSSIVPRAQISSYSTGF